MKIKTKSASAGSVKRVASANTKTSTKDFLVQHMGRWDYALSLNNFETNGRRAQ